MSNIKLPNGIGLKVQNQAQLGQNVLLLSTFTKNFKSILEVEESSDGLVFKNEISNISLKAANGRQENLNNCSNFRLFDINNYFILTYSRYFQGKYFLRLAISKDFKQFKASKSLCEIDGPSYVLDLDNERKIICLVYKSQGINLSLIDYSKFPKIINSQRLLNESVKDISIADVKVVNNLIRVIYFEKIYQNQEYYYVVKAILFDRKYPYKTVSRSEKPLWIQPLEWKEKNLVPLGLVELKDKVISYWISPSKGLFACILPTFELKGEKLTISQVILKRLKENPILKPITRHFWESKAVFNPSAIYDREKIHIIYRAIGDNDSSVVGYARSSDGVNIDLRHNKPIYTPRATFELGDPSKPFIQGKFVSGGGGFGGCEDARLTRIGNRVYMTYVAFNGWSPPRVALTSIDREDFINHNWKWEKPVLISRPNVVDKNACILPEKINGKYVIFHRIFPDILIDFVDDLNFDGKTKFLRGEYKISPRKNFWDSRKIGVGPAPIKTKDGWLTIYQAVGNQDPGRYKIGAMILRGDDPTKVLYRSNEPILEPIERYENEGYKAGVVYPCGAVVKDSDLFVYYGGADSYTCVAKANVSQFISQLKNTGSTSLFRINNTNIN